MAAVIKRLILWNCRRFKLGVVKASYCQWHCIAESCVRRFSVCPSMSFISTEVATTSTIDLSSPRGPSSQRMSIKEKILRAERMRKHQFELADVALQPCLKSSEWSPSLWQQCCANFLKIKYAPIEAIEIRFMSLCGSHGLLYPACELLKEITVAKSGPPPIFLLVKYLEVCSCCIDRGESTTLAQQEFDRVFHLVHDQLMDHSSRHIFLFALCRAGRFSTAEKILNDDWRQIEDTIITMDESGEPVLQGKFNHLFSCGNELARTAFLCGQWETAWRAVDLLASHKVLVDSKTLEACLTAVDRCVAAQSRDRISAIIEHIMKDVSSHDVKERRNESPEQMLLRLLTYLKQYQRPVTTQMVTHLSQLCTRRLAQKWTAKTTYVSSSGFCENCGHMLNESSLTDEEFDRLRKDFFSRVLVGCDMFINSNPDEVTRFEQFVETNAPFDIVIDGLNVFYQYSGEDEHKVRNLLKVVDHFADAASSSGGKNRVLLIGRHHLFRKSGKMTRYIRQKASIFSLENNSADDMFLLYAVLSSHQNTTFVSGDYFRNYGAALPVDLRDLFFRLLRKNRVAAKMSMRGRCVIQMPYFHNIAAQCHDNGVWHIPYDEKSRGVIGNICMSPSDTFGDKWLCLHAPPSFRHLH